VLYGNPIENVVAAESMLKKIDFTNPESARLAREKALQFISKAIAQQQAGRDNRERIYSRSEANRVAAAVAQRRLVGNGAVA
jgi:hypothetical protein